MLKNFPLIRCPYCFCEFPHDKVCFKAQTVFTSQDVESMGDEECMSEADGREKPVVSRVVREKFIEKEDLKYKNFWNEYPGSEPDWRYKNYPVITPESVDMMKDGNGYCMDRGGFIASVFDCFGKESRWRICPECHNNLPNGYGKYPVYTIAVVGITNSGKTVYLSYLMQNFNKFMQYVGLSARMMGENVQRFIEENRVAKGLFLPQGTLPEHLSQPLFYLVKSDRQSWTLVFYDIAGETCVKPDKMEKYGSFIRNADGIILMLDPEQFVSLRKDPDCEVLEPEAVLNAMSETFLEADSEDGRSDKPLAVVISKSDLLVKRAKNLSSESNAFQRIEYREQGFQQAAYRNLNGELRNMLSKLSQGKAVMATLKSCFLCYSFFAVSVLDAGVEEVEVETPQGEKNFKYMPKNSPSGIRAEEPLLWILNKRGIIPTVGDRQKKKKAGWIGKLIEYFRANRDLS